MSARKMDRWWMIIVAFLIAAGMVLLVVLTMKRGPGRWRHAESRAGNAADRRTGSPPPWRVGAPAAPPQVDAPVHRSCRRRSVRTGRL